VIKIEVFDIDISKFTEEAELLKTLGHPTRLCIVYCLIKKGGGCNVSTMYTCLKLPQPTISQHLNKLKQLKIVKTERIGTEIFYSVENPVVIKLVKSLFQNEEE